MPHPGRSLTATACLGLLLLGSVAPSQAAEGAAFSVSAPPLPTVGEPGRTAISQVRVANPATGPVTFDLAVLPLRPEDDGRIAPAQPDDFSRATSVPPTVTVPAGSTGPVQVRTEIPGDAQPDIHVVGILVRPQAGPSADVHQQVQIVVPVSVQIGDGAGAGAVAVEQDVDRRWLVLGEVHVRYRLVNTGTSGVVVSSGGAPHASGPLSAPAVSQTPAQTAQALAAGRRKSFDLTWRAPRWGIGLVRTEIHAEWDGADGPQEVRASGPRVLVIPPTTLALLLLILGAVVLLVLRRRRRTGYRGSTRRHHP